MIAAVRFARDNDLAIAVRGGGHNGGGLGTVDDGLVIDLAALRGVRVDPVERTVTVEGGATLGDVDHATHAFGLAVPGGIISTTGVGGLTLGGGIGHLTRGLGLTIDNLIGVDVVLADGSFVRADATHNEDLFWAVRGGGGNFGVVTSFTFRAQPVSTVNAGPMLWQLDDAPEVMRFYREFIGRRAARARRLLRLSDGAAGAAVPGGAPPEEDVRHRVDLHRLARGGRARPQAGARLQGAGARRRHAAAPAGLEQPPSTRSTRAASSSTGAPTSSTSSPTRRSRRTPSTPPSCRPGSRPCTSTRSTAPPPTRARPTRRGPTATPSGPR